MFTCCEYLEVDEITAVSVMNILREFIFNHLIYSTSNVGIFSVNLLLIQAICTKAWTVTVVLIEAF